MDKELEKYCEDYFDLFRTEGFKTLLKELEDQAERIDSVEYTKDSNDLYFRKGQLNVLSFILNLERTIHRIYEDHHVDQ